MGERSVKAVKSDLLTCFPHDTRFCVGERSVKAVKPRSDVSRIFFVTFVRVVLA